MAFSPEGVGGWYGLVSDWRKESANRPYLQDLAQANRDTAMADARMKQAEAMYSPEYFSGRSNLINNQSNLTGEQAKYYGADTNSQIAMRDAQRGLIGQEMKYMPLKYAIEAGNSMRATDRFGGSYQLAKTLQSMSPAARESFIADNQEAYTQMLADLGNKVKEDKQGRGNDIVTRMANQFFPPPQDNLTLGQEDQNRLAAAGIAKPQGAGMPQMGGLAGQPPPMQSLPMNPNTASAFASQPDQVERQRLANQMSANKALTTGKTQTQMEGAVQVKNILSDPALQSRAESAANYAGAAGKGKSAITALTQTNPKAYEDYLTFKNVDMVLLNNRIKMLDGMGATDAQRQELNGLYTKAMDSLTSNPAQFKTQFKQLQNSLANVAQSVQKSATPIFPVNRLEPGQIQSAQPQPQMGGQPPAMGGAPNPQALQQMAQEAIAAGADPAAVNQHLQMLLSQGGG